MHKEGWFHGGLLFLIHNNTLKVEEWHRSSAYCERKRRVKMGRYRNKTIIYELLIRWTFGVLEWLCLSGCGGRRGGREDDWARVH